MGGGISVTNKCDLLVQVLPIEIYPLIKDLPPNILYVAINTFIIEHNYLLIKLLLMKFLLTI